MEQRRGDDEVHDDVVSLPEEIIREILFRVRSAKSLMRFKCVCKTWHSLICDSRFATMHRHHGRRRKSPGSSSFSALVFHLPQLSLSNDAVLFVAHNDDDDDHKDGRLNVQRCNGFPVADQISGRVIGSCNGIVCLYSRTSIGPRQVHLWNPATRELKRLPHNDNLPSPVHYVFNTLLEFIYDPLTDDYKVLSVCQYGRVQNNRFVYRYGVDMYSLASNSWREIDDNAGILFPPGRGDLTWFSDMVNGRSSGVVNGHDLHWIAKRTMPRPGAEDTEQSEWCMLRFQLQSEVFDQPVEPPPGLKTTDHRHHEIKLGKLRECLSLTALDSARGKTHIWVMEEYGVPSASASNSWTKFLTICHADPPSNFLEWSLLGLESSGNLVMGYDYNEEGLAKLDLNGPCYTKSWPKPLVWYDLGPSNRPCRATESEGDFCFGCELVSHVQTIFPIKAGKHY